MAENNSTKVVVENTGISFVVAFFDDQKSAAEAFNQLKDAQREGYVAIQAAAYMEKSERSRIKIHEYKDWSGKNGVLAGGAAGAIVGLIGSTVLLPLTVGALVGGVMAKLHDTNFNNQELKDIAKLLPVGTSALIAIVEDSHVQALEDELSENGGKKIHSGEVPNSTIISIQEIYQVSEVATTSKE